VVEELYFIHHSRVRIPGAPKNIIQMILLTLSILVMKTKKFMKTKK